MAIYESIINLWNWFFAPNDSVSYIGCNFHAPQMTALVDMGLMPDYMAEIDGYVKKPTQPSDPYLSKAVGNSP
ncbi:hypothetical protein [Candidatus Synchoanobacter obligatus]|uniref:Uncharacterized protein n=1 Tax=Candidatus Synchoanobacter obligatus TaxID=2919597 RepID=A0ABT1L5I0_9GAMM|nr:hypothetical protein [Candidatus Synchoanobacter obligatus]MCP8352128.1 hypothetical protein [Candidatus Synchoanobacter obligatus]